MVNLFRVWVCFVALLAGLAWPAAQVSACPGCRDALATSKNGSTTPWDSAQDAEGLAYSKSVLFMLAMPFLLVSGFGFACYRMARTAAMAQAAPAPQPRAVPVPPSELGLS